MTTYANICKNIRDNAVDGEHISGGFRWYDDAREQVVKFDNVVKHCFPDEHVSLSHTIGVIAIASANCTVQENWSRALDWFKGNRVPLVHRNLVTYTDQVCRFGNHDVGTKKTEPFRIALTRGDSKPFELVIPVLDRHAVWGATNGAVDASPSDTLQSLIVRGYHRVAKETGVPVTLLQSWGWHSVIKQKGNSSDVIKPFAIGDYAACHA